MQICRNVCLMNYHGKLYKVHQLKFDLENTQKKRKSNNLICHLMFLLEVVLICRCPLFIDERKYSEMDRPLFVLRREKKRERQKVEPPFRE